MRMLLPTLALLLFFTLNGQSQQSVDGSFAFQTDPAKKYSIYIPSTYDAAVPNKLMLGLHPLNTNRWDGESWRDTLIAFAEMTQVLLVCPDGGSDGRIDDPIDTAFTSALLDSVYQWYNIDEDKQYIIGFSWGGLTTYTYGLRRTQTFGGFIPIGAAINGSGPLSGLEANAANTPWFLIHGSSDSPNTRFYPLQTYLQDNNAIVNDTFMVGVGHTIDFPDRNNILARAFYWVDSVNCIAPVDTMDSLTGLISPQLEDVKFISTETSTMLHFSGSSSTLLHVQLIQLNGTILRNEHLDLRAGESTSLFNGLSGGSYIVTARDENGYAMVHRFVRQ